jgi:DnaK suppressor protein
MIFMDSKLIEASKIKLSEEKKRLEGLLSRFASKEKNTTREDFTTRFPNIGDSQDENASEVELYVEELGEERFLEERLRKVNAAVERIAAGTYGRCSVGGEEIEAARLSVAPEAETCVKHSA